MNGWISKTWMTRPMSRPKVVPVSSTRAITTEGFHPASRSAAAIIIERATTDPTERSIPPVRMTKVMPTASTIRKVLSMRRLRKTCPDRKPGYIPAPMANIARNSPMVARVGA
jgi:hypothetical protein